MEAKSIMERRRNETNLEFGKIFNSKKFNKITEKSELTLFRERCIIAEEQAQIKDSEKRLNKNLMEIEQRKLSLASEVVLSDPSEMTKIPQDFLNKPGDNEVNNYRANVAEKQKKYWG